MTALQMDPPLVLDDVWKTFGRAAAVRGLSLAVPAGSVYGFLGPNGAGKSTTIRMILGLLRPDRGRVALFGHAARERRVSALRRVGAMVESPSLYQHLTARENLEIHRLLLDLPRRDVETALETVGLARAAGQVVREFSSGMKQRLGLAIALLGQPELLLLDEPTNALDPAGIHEVRTLVRDLPQRCGVTVFVSSHLLAEVEQTATHVAIVSRGQVQFSGTADALRGRGRHWILVDADRPEDARALLSAEGLPASLESGRLRVAADDGWTPAAVNRALVRGEIAVSRLVMERPTLEEAFLDLTGKEEHV